MTSLPVALAAAPLPVTFDDGFFERGDWTHYYSDGRFEQRLQHGGGPIYCETLLTLDCRVEDSIELLRGPWTWWDHGRALHFRDLPDGSAEQTLCPVRWFWTRVQVRVFPPVPLEQEPGVRLPVLLSRHFRGPASIDVFTRGGAVVLRGRFHGVENHVPLVPVQVVGPAHLRAEAGTCLPPFPGRTGWCGLCRRLEGRCPGTGCGGQFFPGTPRAAWRNRR